MTQYSEMTKTSSNSQRVLSRTDLAQLCATVGCPPPESSVEQLAVYLELLIQWNKVMNLVGTHTWQSAFLRLAADSLLLAPFLDTLPLVPHDESVNLQVWDLGAGAGLPGIPLRAVWDRGEYWMIEAREKRAMFLSTVLAHTRLPRTHVFHGRAEAFFVQQGHKADMIVSRAFLPWEQVLQLVQPVLAPQGLVVFLASDSAPQVLPAGFSVHSQHSYTIAARKSWFWAVKMQ